MRYLDQKIPLAISSDLGFSQYPSSRLKIYREIKLKEIKYDSLTFKLDTTYEDKQKIELWQSMIYDEAWGYAYVEDIWGEINITQLGRDGNEIYKTGKSAF